MKNSALKNKILFIVIVSLSALLLSACSDSPKDDNKGRSLLERQELYFNHELLSILYIRAEQELKPVQNYMGRGDRGQFGDVVEMFRQMSCRYTNYFTPIEADYIWQLIFTSGGGDSINPPTVFLEFFEDIPIIQITMFSGETAVPGGTLTEFRNVLRKIEGAPIGIIDLRGNPGGSVFHCLGAADELVSDGELTRRIEHGLRDEIPVIDTLFRIATRGGLGINTQWIFLADKMSASCSELMLSAVRQNRDVLLIGETTFGKAVGQYYISTIADGLAGITALQFFDKNWGTYQDKGIAPDIDINPKEALDYALNYILSQQDDGTLKRNAPISQREMRALNQQMNSRQLPASDTLRGGAWEWRGW